MKRFLKSSAVLAAVVVLALLALPFLIDANRFRPLLEQQLSKALSRQVTVGDLSLALLDGGVSASNIAISEDPQFGQQPFLGAKALSIGVDLPALIFSGLLHVQAVTVEGADVNLIQNAEGNWNVSTLGAAKESASPPAGASPAPAPAETPLEISVNLIRIQNTHVSVVQETGKRDLEDVNFELRGLSATSALPFSLAAAVGGGGTISLTGTAGPVVQENAASTPFDTQVEIKGLDLAAAGFTNPDLGMGGLLTFIGSVNSNGKTAAVKGAATIDRLRLSRPGGIASRPVALNLALVHDLESRSGNIARSTIKLGSASATIGGTYDLKTPSPTIDITLAGPGMPLPELLAFLPVFDIVLPSGAAIEGGTLSLDITSRGTVQHLNTKGSIKIEKAKLTNYDLGSKLRIIQQLAGLPTTASTDIDLASASFEMGSFGTHVRDIKFVAPSIGELTGDGTVNPMHELDFKMSAVVKTGGLLAAAIQQRGDTTTVPFFIQGTSGNPVFKADVKSVANEKLQQALKNPEGAVKNVKDLANTAKGILNMFKKAPQKQPDPQ